MQNLGSRRLPYGTRVTKNSIFKVVVTVATYHFPLQRQIMKKKIEILSKGIVK